MKALIADDEKVCRDLIKVYLDEIGCDVDVACDGIQARDMLVENQYDFVFFDCNMPGLTGVELVEIMKDRNANAKKVMISGYDLINEEFVKNLGVDLLLRKPISMEKIEELIKNG